MERFDLKVKGNNLIRKMIGAEPYIMQKPLTNADHIRVMTNEELAKLGAKGCPYSSARNMCAVCGDGCYRCWLDWLNQEVKDG